MDTYNSMAQKVWTAEQVPAEYKVCGMEGRAPHQEICHLKDLLVKERANSCREYNWRVQFSQELEQTKQQLAKQKRLKEMFINRAKEAKKDAERLHKYSDAETLSTAKIATQVSNGIKRMKKKDLQRDYEELQVALTTSQEKFNTELQEERQKVKVLQEELERLRAAVEDVGQGKTAGREKLTTELQEERQKNKVLQEELKKLKAAVKEVRQSYEADVQTARQLTDKLQHELQKEVQSQEDKLSQDELLQSLKDEQDALRRQMAEEIRLVQQNASVQEREIEELKSQLSVELSLNRELKELRGVRQADETEDEQETETSSLVVSLYALPDPEPKETEEPETTKTTKRDSVWKRVRRSLGLRKPQKWKKSAEPASTSGDDLTSFRRFE